MIERSAGSGRSGVSFGQFAQEPMRTRRILAVLAGAAALWGAALPMAAPGVMGAWGGPAAVAAVAATGGWGRATGVPGLEKLNAGGGAEILSLSCASGGSCAAGGYFTDRRGHQQGFVVSERHGRWGQAIRVPGLATLDKGGFAQVRFGSCPSAGDCAAGGVYDDVLGHVQAFVVGEQHGRWGQAIAVPGLAALNAGGQAVIFSLSCGSAGSCSAGGHYTDAAGDQQAFVVSEQHGRWGQASAVPGLAVLNAGEQAEVFSVSCASAGNCSAGGYYSGADRRIQGFVIGERHGRWGQATAVPGLAALNTGGFAEIFSLSCGSPGNCTAGGSYADVGLSSVQGFVVSEQHGRWGQASAVPGLAALNTGGAAEIFSMSCVSPGNCTAGGYYRTTSEFNHQAFVASQRNGRWGKAITVPGLATLNAGDYAQTSSVSCSRAGNCAAGGYYSVRFPFTRAFVASQQHGRWTKAIQAPGTNPPVSDGGALVTTVSCPPVGHCTAGGSYIDRHNDRQAFVLTQT